MKKSILIISLIFLAASAIGQTITFTTQAKVDSFVAVMDTSKLYGLIFINDENIPKSKQIKDLSGFNQNRIIGVTIKGFEWKDIPWFTSNFGGGFNVIDMPFLETISGINNYIGGLQIDNCPSLKAYPPKGVLKYCNSVHIRNIDKESLTIDLTGVSKYPKGANWSDRLFVYSNNTKHLEIKDPNGVISDLLVQKDSVMRYFELKGGAETMALKLTNNKNLDSIRGFENPLWISVNGGIFENPKLEDLCVMRNALDSFYRWLPTSQKASFFVFNNGLGASSYNGMMAADCSWLETISVKEENVKASKMLVYPNPASTAINVTLLNENTSGVIKLYNVQGVLIFEKEINPNENLHFSTAELSRGMYVLDYVGSNGENERMKVVLQ